MKGLLRMGCNCSNAPVRFEGMRSKGTKNALIVRYMEYVMTRGKLYENKDVNARCYRIVRSGGGAYCKREELRTLS